MGNSIGHRAERMAYLNPARTAKAETVKIDNISQPNFWSGVNNEQ